MIARRRRTSLSESAYQKLRERIITLALPPGAQVQEGGLARELALGRTPVREALLRLVNEGFLTSIPGRGFFVCDVTVEGVRSLFEAVMILERGVAALAARRIARKELDRLEVLHRQIGAAMSARNYLRVTRLNSLFHRTIHESARNPLLAAALYNLEPQYHRLAYLCFSEVTEPEGLRAHFAKVTDDHARLIETLHRGDEWAAVQTITDHIALFHARVARYLFPSMQAIEAALGRQPPGIEPRRGRIVNRPRRPTAAAAGS